MSDDTTFASSLQAVLDISDNPLKCTKELHYLMEWLVRHSVAPRAGAGAAGGAGSLHSDLLHAVEDMMEERSFRVRWAALYDKLCGDRAFDRERVKLQDNILASSPTPASVKKASVTQEELDDIKIVLGKKKMEVPASMEDEDDDDDDDDFDGDSYSDSDDGTTANANVEDATDDGDDDDEDDEDDDEYDDNQLISDATGNGTDYLAFTHRGSPYLWPVLTIGALLAATVLIVSNVVVCIVRRRRARRHARYQSPMFRQLAAVGHHKAFAGIPGSFIKTKKDGGFVYRKLYEDTTTPVFVPQPQAPQARTFRFPLDPSDLQAGAGEAHRV